MHNFSQTSLKSRRFKAFFILYKELEHYMPMMERRKSRYLLTCWGSESAKKLGSANKKSTNYKSAKHKKRLGPQIANPKSATFAGGLQI
jgi:hypothetical protein